MTTVNKYFWYIDDEKPIPYLQRYCDREQCKGDKIKRFPVFSSNNPQSVQLWGVLDEETKTVTFQKPQTTMLIDLKIKIKGPKTSPKKINLQEKFKPISDALSKYGEDIIIGHPFSIASLNDIADQIKRRYHLEQISKLATTSQLEDLLEQFEELTENIHNLSNRMFRELTHENESLQEYIPPLGAHVQMQIDENFAQQRSTQGFPKRVPLIGVDFAAQRTGDSNPLIGVHTQDPPIDLQTCTDKFLKASNEVLLILGDSGTGKTLASWDMVRQLNNRIINWNRNRHPSNTMGNKLPISGLNESKTDINSPIASEMRISVYFHETNRDKIQVLFNSLNFEDEKITMRVKSWHPFTSELDTIVFTVYDTIPADPIERTRVAKSFQTFMERKMGVILNETELRSIIDTNSYEVTYAVIFRVLKDPSVRTKWVDKGLVDTLQQADICFLQALVKVDESVPLQERLDKVTKFFETLESKHNFLFGFDRAQLVEKIARAFLSSTQWKLQNTIAGSQEVCTCSVLHSTR